MALKGIQLENLPEFDDHQFLSYIFDTKSNLRVLIALHRVSSKYPAFGATRLWHYQNDHEAIRDVLSLSKTMSYKAALANLPCGGAKAVILNGVTSSKKELLLKNYARRINILGGKFITGADVGISFDDVKYMRRYSPFFVGTKFDPVEFTVMGLIQSLKVCLKEVFGNSLLNERTFAIQGAGKTGYGLLKAIYKDAKKVYISDINKKRLYSIKKEFPRVNITSSQAIYEQKVDVFSPCALSKVLNHKTLDKLNCPIIIGSANSQLEDANLGKSLYKKGILYAPDYVVNAGGLISVFNEYDNAQLNKGILLKKIEHIPRTLSKIIDKSKATNKPTNVIADEIGLEVINNNFV